MRKRVAIPLAIVVWLILMMVIFYNIGKNMEPIPKTLTEEESESEPPEPVQDIVIQDSKPEQKIDTSAASANPLINTPLIEAPIINTVNKRIGTWAYIVFSERQLLEEVTLEDLAEFSRTFQGKGYNRVSIMCPEGTGLVFSGDGNSAQYGMLDKTGRMAGEVKDGWSIYYDQATEKFIRMDN